MIACGLKGDGGDGGSIIVIGDSNLWTLQSFRFKKHFKAGNGGDGGGSKKSGLTGKNISHLLLAYLH